MSGSVDFAPLVPVALIAALGGIGLVMVLLGALALVSLVFALLNPAIREEDREALSDIAVLVVDRSQSQEIGKRTELLADAETQVKDVPESMQPLGYDGPLHALITGRPGERDRRLIIENAPRFAFVGQQQMI